MNSIPYIEFLNVTIPARWFNYAFFFMLGLVIALTITTRSLNKLKGVMNRRYNDLINKSMEFILEIGLRTGINVKPHIELLEELKS